jgi:molybdopterin-dependent oxidoreductase alpha subunit
MILRKGSSHYEPISWEGAFQKIAEELNALDSPDDAIFYTSGRTSNEAAFLYQLLVRLFGTNNLPDCSNMCHESSGAALYETLGVGKGTVLLQDFELADTIFLIGQNPGTNHPRMLGALQSAVRRGCQVVSINPIPEVGMMQFQHPQEVLQLIGSSSTPITTLFLQVRINGDVALLKGIMKAMLEEEERRPGKIFDHHFIASHTSGFEAFIEDLRGESWEVIIEESGIDRERIQQAAEVVMRSKRLICCWAMGLTQHKNAVANIQEIINLLLLGGHIGRPGAGACPVRGHSNVQGDRTMGIWERMSDSFLDRLGAEFGFEPPRKPGYDTVDAIQAMYNKPGMVFFAMGGNFLAASPDTEYTARALQNCRLTVQVSTKLNRAHLVTGEEALILPCLGRTELDQQQGGLQFVTVEDSMSMVHPSRGTLPPASEHLRSEPAIVAGLARALFGNRYPIDWEGMTAHYDTIRDHIANVVFGFEDFNLRIYQDGMFHLPNSAAERRFRTRSGKAQFTVHPIPRIALEPGQLRMMTIRSHDQFNTTIYGLDDRYRGVENGRRVIFLNEEDIRALGFTNGQRVDIYSHFEGEERVAPGFQIVAFDLPRRCAATYYPETNVLVPVRNVAEKSNTPVSKSVVISLRPALQTRL